SGGGTSTAGTVTYSQSYSYDGLNRVSGASESIVGGAQQWSQSYDVDRWGNRAVRVGSTIPSPNLTPQSIVAGDFAAFEQGTNRLNKANANLLNVSYDNGGNLLHDAGSGTMSYDGENRQTSYNGGLGAINYSYDGDGRRVMKVDTTQGPT